MPIPPMPTAYMAAGLFDGIDRIVRFRAGAPLEHLTPWCGRRQRRVQRFEARQRDMVGAQGLDCIVLVAHCHGARQEAAIPRWWLEGAGLVEVGRAFAPPGVVPGAAFDGFQSLWRERVRERLRQVRKAWDEAHPEQAHEMLTGAGRTEAAQRQAKSGPHGPLHARRQWLTQETDALLDDAPPTRSSAHASGWARVSGFTREAWRGHLKAMHGALATAAEWQPTDSPAHLDFGAKPAARGVVTFTSATGDIRVVSTDAINWSDT